MRYSLAERCPIEGQVRSVVLAQRKKRITLHRGGFSNLRTFRNKSKLVTDMYDIFGGLPNNSKHKLAISG
jgi:hypothetical protein